MICTSCGSKLGVYRTFSYPDSCIRYYKCSTCGSTYKSSEEIIMSKEITMESKFADMISWCQAIANAYEAYSKGRMSKEVYLAIFKEKLKDKPDMKDMEVLTDEL